MADTGESGGARFPSEEDVETLQRMAHRDVMDANADPSALSPEQHEYVYALQALASMATSHLEIPVMVEVPKAA
jgi:hypothetical protein